MHGCLFAIVSMVTAIMPARAQANIHVVVNLPALCMCQCVCVCVCQSVCVWCSLVHWFVLLEEHGYIMAECSPHVCKLFHLPHPFSIRDHPYWLSKTHIPDCWRCPPLPMMLIALGLLIQGLVIQQWYLALCFVLFLAYMYTNVVYNNQGGGVMACIGALTQWSCLQLWLLDEAVHLCMHARRVRLVKTP